MTSIYKRRRSLRVGLAMSCAVIALAGCAETQLGVQAVKSVARTDEVSTTATTTDGGLAPAAFDATGLTIWDGAATLQGVWLAHPLAQRAQRVRVYNNENGLETEGALFRRDPALSGPSILVSSDAARALGVTPGEPTELRIVALREGPPTRIASPDDPAVEAAELEVETAALAPPPSAADGAEGELGDTTADGADGALTAGAAEETALASAQSTEVAAETDVVPAPDPIEETAPVAEAEAIGGPSSEAPVVADADAQPRAGDEDIELAETAVETAPPADPAPEEAAATAPPAPAPTPETAPATTTAASAAASAAEPAPTPRPETAEKPAPRTPSGSAASSLPSGDYVQVGSFGVERNAIALVARLSARGQNARYVKRTIRGTPFSIVVIGPLPNAAAIAAAKDAAVKEGLRDSIRVTI